MVLERNNAMELKPSLQVVFEAVRKVCEDVMAVMEDLHRLALRGTPRQLKELEVGAGRLKWAVPRRISCQLLGCTWAPCMAQQQVLAAF